MDYAKHIVTVGDGRGFVVEGPGPPLPKPLPKFLEGAVITNPKRRYVITAAHCLPKLPPAHRCSYTEERTYRILGSLGEKNPNIFTECVFVDPVSDLAILGEPDTQALAEVVGEEEADAYGEFVDSIPPMPIGELREEEEIFVLQLDGHWTRGKGEPLSWSTLWLTEVVEGIHGGMSGSPIINQRGEAVGLVTSSGGTGKIHTEGSNPNLAPSLPAWFYFSKERTFRERP